ncbi:MAG: hypothetical protein GX335_06745 [Firmicutes bacterium]|nr:hypothetical protein [Bacillota bacterium]
MSLLQKKIRIGLLSDLHVNGKEELDLLAEIMRFFALQELDLVVELGDRLQDKSAGADLEQTAKIRQVLTKPGLPVLHLHGNHDLRFAPKDALNEVLAKEHGYERYFVNDYQIVLLDSNDPSPGLISPEQSAWLKAAIKADFDSIIFSHYPLAPIEVEEHPYFYQHREKSFILNYEDIKDAVSFEKGVIAVYQGHLHWLKQRKINGVPFTWLPSVRKSFDGGFPAGGFCIAEARGRKVEEEHFKIVEEGSRRQFVKI